MGYPGKSKKIYNTPHHPWQKARIEEETALVKKFGLRNKKSVWKFASMLRKIRGQARALLGVIGTGRVTEGLALCTRSSTDPGQVAEARRPEGRLEARGHSRAEDRRPAGETATDPRIQEGLRDLHEAGSPVHRTRPHLR